ncbi:MAG: hypothetical protein ACYC18_13890 [Gammaproteobacteria bacterium]
MTTGLKAGDQCVELVIQDNGPNDQDVATGAITDPGGVAQLSPSSSSGCSISPTPVSALRGGDWWLVDIVIGWLGCNRRRALQRV